MITRPPVGRIAVQIACRAMVESVFIALKAELVRSSDWHSRRDVEIAIFDYINGVYNPRGKHSVPGWTSHLAFEHRAAQDEHQTGTKPVQDHGLCGGSSGRQPPVTAAERVGRL